MKTMKKIALCLITLSIVSCTSDSEQNTNEDLMTLNKRIIFNRQSAFPDNDTKEIQYYSNNEVVADTVFNSLNQWTQRKLVFFNGTTKVFQTLDTSGQIIAHREETYDNQGQVTGRRTYVPNNNILAVSFTYNSDNTITANAVNLQDQSVTPHSTYEKDSDGLIYKQFQQTVLQIPNSTVESTLLFDNLKPVSLVNTLNTSVISFDYYSNPKPSNLVKSNTELNNRTLLALSLTKMAEEGNFYYKRLDASTPNTVVTYQTDFNINNYIEYYKSTYIDPTGGNNMLTTEIFYYYN